jgi:hypothetical protein
MKVAFDALSDLEPEERSRAVQWLTSALDLEPPISRGPQSLATVIAAESGDRPAVSQSSEAPTPKAFIAEKKPQTAVERVTCLAYYLAHWRDAPAFKTPDIVELNTEAASPKLSNARRDVNNAAQSNGFLASAGRGAKQITSRGEALVEALPDREAVKQALQDHPYRRRTRRTTARGGTARKSKQG